MPLPSFTIDPDLTVNDVDGTVATGELVETPLAGTTFTFTCNVDRKQFVTFGDSMDRIRPVVATVDEDGALLKDGAPVRLLANDPGLSHSGVQWNVLATLPDGKRMAAWPFDAPDDGDVLDLTTTMAVASQPGQFVTRGPAGPPVDDVALVGDELQFYVDGEPVGDPLALPDSSGGDVDGGTP